MRVNSAVLRWGLELLDGDPRFASLVGGVSSHGAGSMMVLMDQRNGVKMSEINWYEEVRSPYNTPDSAGPLISIFAQPQSAEDNQPNALDPRGLSEIGKSAYVLQLDVSPEEVIARFLKGDRPLTEEENKQVRNFFKENSEAESYPEYGIVLRSFSLPAFELPEDGPQPRLFTDEVLNGLEGMGDSIVRIPASTTDTRVRHRRTPKLA